MKNLKMISAFAILFVALSCNNDDNSDQNLEENGFFSEDVLKVGNKWVYKTYEKNSPIDNSEDFVFNGVEIYREITGEVIKNDILFYIMSIKYFNNTNEDESSEIRYVRINQSGHFISISEGNFNEELIDENYGYVFHPGNDFEYVYTYLFTGEVAVEMKLYPSENILVEGNNYEVAPYKATFQASEETSEDNDRIEEYYFNKNVGFVKVRFYNGSDYAFEHRLVSFTPGD